jgi:hypothetical protein
MKVYFIYLDLNSSKDGGEGDVEEDPSKEHSGDGHDEDKEWGSQKEGTTTSYYY